MRKTYLVERRGGLHFRIRVPAGLRELFGSRELKRSLTHLSKRHAQAEALRLACLALDFFGELTMSQKEYTNEQLQKIVNDWLNQTLRQQVTRYRLARREGREPPEPALRDPEQLEALWFAATDFVDQIRHGDPRQVKETYDHWEPFAADVAESMGIDFQNLSAEERERLTLLTLAAEARRFGLLTRHSPDFLADFWEEPRSGPAPQPQQTEDPAPTLAEAWDRCVSHYQARGRKSWQITDESGRPRKNQHANWLRQDLFELWGRDLPISEISWEHLEELRDCFQDKYPAGRKRKAKYRNLSLREIMDGPEVPEEERIRGSGKESKFRLARDFFKFLRTNPHTKIHLKHEIEEAEEALKVAPDPVSTYEPWTPDEVKTILESQEVHSRFLRRNENYHPAGMFWLLAMLAYTGARQQEIMGLRAEDVELDSEYPVIHIREHEHRPQVKSEVSVRWVPIHCDLLEMGLADWIEFRAQFNQPTLWPVSQRGSNYWADRFREDITKPLGLYKSRKKVMHSFRSTFDSLASNVMPTEARRLMTGHVGQGTDYRHYLRQLDEFIPSYSDYINRIELRLDLEKLKDLWRSSLP